MVTLQAMCGLAQPGSVGTDSRIFKAVAVCAGYNPVLVVIRPHKCVGNVRGMDLFYLFYLYH